MLLFYVQSLIQGALWPWSYGSWIYNDICNQCLSPLMLWVRIWIRGRCTTLCDKVCQWRSTCRWFSLVPPVSSTNKTDRHDITEILLKVVLSTFKQTISIFNSSNLMSYLLCQIKFDWHLSIVFYFDELLPCVYLCICLLYVSLVLNKVYQYHDYFCI